MTTRPLSLHPSPEPTRYHQTRRTPLGATTTTLTHRLHLRTPPQPKRSREESRKTRANSLPAERHSTWCCPTSSSFLYTTTATSHMYSRTRHDALPTILRPDNC